MTTTPLQVVSESGALPPNLFNEEAERGLLGAVLLDNGALEAVAEVVEPAQFIIEAHREIFDAVLKLRERGMPASPTTLGPQIEASEAVKHIGGAAYLARLVGDAITVVNAKHYGQIIADLHLKRELLGISRDIAGDVCDTGLEDAATDQLERAEQRLYDLATQGHRERGFVGFDVALGEAVSRAAIAHERDGGLAGVTTGFVDLDGLLGGLHDSDLVILAGRPSMGKTALATNVSFNAAERYLATKGDDGAAVAFFSLEMSAEQLAARILCEQADVKSDALRKGSLSQEEFDRVFEISATLSELPLYIDDSAALSVGALKARARRLQRQHGIGLIVVDYLQLISNPTRNKNDNRVQEVSEITRGLKVMAKELNMPVLALSQLSRNVESRDNKRPQLSDLRDSGSIEQDADVVAFIYRHEYYMEKARPEQRDGEADGSYQARLAGWEERLNECRNMAEVLVRKQRHGPIGEVGLMFDADHTRFANLAHTAHQYDGFT